MKRELEKILKLSLKTCESWVQYDANGNVFFLDPIDGTEIPGHYGATHAAAAFIILGTSNKDTELLEKGKKLLKSVLKRWDESTKISDFHFDFNNFALCVVYDVFRKSIDDVALLELIRTTVCNTADSNHNTINWLPMRWYVNLKKHEWTGDEKYKRKAESCKATISNATNKDGGIEDILPKGSSFNLQYDIATKAVLQFLRCRGIDVNLSKELGFLSNAMAPDGDINYQGRGSNQIFAWGMWIYLQTSSKNENEINKTISFLSKRLPIMLKNNNIMLNNWRGKEKYLWWDYHYCSVYTSHFLFWLALSKIDYKKKEITIQKSDSNETGVIITKTDQYFISTFNGRKKYLAEAGPVISAIWLKKYGMINKGLFGPWLGTFGNKYSYGDVVLRNYCGLLKMSKNYNWTINILMRKLLPNIRSRDYISISPSLSEFSTSYESNTLIIKFYNRKRENVALNFPILEDLITVPSLSLLVNKKPMVIMNNLKIRTQYGWSNIYQSQICNAEEWILKIK